MVGQFYLFFVFVGGSAVAVNFPLRIASAASYRLCLVFSLSSISRYVFLISSFSSLTHYVLFVSSSRILFNLYVIILFFPFSVVNF